MHACWWLVGGRRLVLHPSRVTDYPSPQPSRTSHHNLLSHKTNTRITLVALLDRTSSPMVKISACVSLPSLVRTIHELGMRAARGVPPTDLHVGWGSALRAKSRGVRDESPTRPGLQFMEPPGVAARPLLRAASAKWQPMEWRHRHVDAHGGSHTPLRWSVADNGCAHGSCRRRRQCSARVAPSLGIKIQSFFGPTLAQSLPILG